MITVKEKDGQKFVVIPKEYELPGFLDYMYINKTSTDENGDTWVPCRPCTVSITKPVNVQTPMGMARSQQTYTELWTYFDIPQKSLLVEVGTDLTEELQLKLKETNQLENKPEEQKESV